MKKALVAIALVLWAVVAGYPQANPSNPCIENSVTNCTTGTGAPFALSVSEPASGWPYTCVGDEISVTAVASNGLPNLLDITTTNEDCSITETVLFLPNTVITNWWQATGEPFTGSGTGSNAVFTPTSCGTGSLVFHLSYVGDSPCDGVTNIVAWTNPYTVVSVFALTPTTPTNYSLVSSNATSQTFAIPVSTNPSVSNLEIVATPCPDISAANLPECWSLDGVLTTNTYVSITNPGVYTVVCTAGTSAMTNIIWVMASDGDVELGCTTNGPVLLGYWSFNNTLVDWWPGENNANDYVGTNNGTLNNVTFTNGYPGSGFYFNGTNSYITFGTNVSNFGTNDFTIDFWMKTSATYEEAILAKRPACEGDVMWDVRMLADGHLFFELNQSPPDGVALTDGHAVNDGIFHEVTIVRTGTAAALYLDGSFSSSSTGYFVNMQNDSELTAGNNPCVGIDGTRYFNGVLDEIKIYINGLGSPWTGNNGQQPLSTNGLQNPASPWGNALQVDTNISAGLSYRYMEDDGTANINCINGAVSFWFKPDWNGGSGPGTNGQLLGIGNGTTNSLWSLSVNSTGSSLSFETASNGNSTLFFTQSIANWTSNDWYQLVLDYSPSQTSLYTNGVLARTGSGMTYYPSISNRLAYGFSIGSSYNGSNQIRGIIDELYTFDCPLSALEVAAGYPGTNENAAPSIITQPVNQTVVVGSNASFSVTAIGTPPLSYQWISDGTNISGATSSICPILNAQAPNAGSYIVVVTNAFGSITSSVAVLTVVSVASLSPTNNTNLLLMSSNGTLQVWGIPTSTNVGATNLEIVATSSPIIAATNFPAGWSLDGVLTNVMYLSLTNPGDYTVVCSAGTSAITNIIVVTTVGDLTNWADGRLRWVCHLPSNVATDANGSGIDSSPAIGPGGTIYVTTAANTLYAINPLTGAVEWTNSDGACTGDIGGEITSSPAVGTNGMIYFGSDRGYLFAVNTNGTTHWKVNVDADDLYPWMPSSPAIGTDGALYVGSWNPYYGLMAVSASGGTNWGYLAGLASSSPIVGADNTVYFLQVPSDAANGSCLNAVSQAASARWIHPISFNDDYNLSGGVEPSPAIDYNGTIYCASEAPWISALNPNGTPKWLFGITKVDGDTNGVYYNIQSSPAVDGSGTVYFGASDDNLYAVTNGVLQWMFTNANGTIFSSPAIAANKTVYVGSTDSNFYAVTNGVLRWVFTNSTGPILSSPAVAGDGTVYFGSEDGNLYAVYGSAPLDTNSPWPMFRRNPQHTASQQSSSLVPTNCSPLVPALVGGIAGVYDLTLAEGLGYSFYASTLDFYCQGPTNSSWDVFMSTNFVDWTNVGNMTLDSYGWGSYGYVMDQTNITPAEVVRTMFIYFSSTNAGGYCSRVMGFTEVRIETGELLADPFYESTSIGNIWSGFGVMYPMNTLQAVVNVLNYDLWSFDSIFGLEPWLDLATSDLDLQIEKSTQDGFNLYTYQGIIGSGYEYAATWYDQSGSMADNVMLLPGECALIVNEGDIPQSIGAVGLVPPPGPVTNRIFAGTNYLSSMLPKAGYIGSDLNFTNASVNDEIIVWDKDLGDYLSYTCVDGASQQWDPAEPHLDIAQGFILVTTNATSWIQEIPACPGESSSTCIYSSITNCSSGSGPGLAVAPVNATNFPFACVGQEIQATASLTAEAPGLLVNIISNEDCYVTTNVLLAASDIVTNSWESTGPGTNSASGEGLTASFAPSSCGVGAVVFTITYNNTSACSGGSGGTSTVSITNAFFVVAAESLAPTNCPTCISVASNGTYQAYVVPPATNVPANVEVLASSCPAFAGPGFPPFWSLNGVQTNLAFVNTLGPATYTLVYTVGNSSITNVYYVLGSSNTNLNVWITEPMNNSTIP